MSEPWRLSATQALALVQADKLTVEEYAKSLLSRIDKRDDEVKAWVYLDPAFILERAKELDSVPKSQRGPLHGLPVAVKDVILTKDMPTQHNSRIYESKQPTGLDAAPVITLRASGALIFGKTCTTEFATSKQGNFHQNLARNAHSANRTPGGSSSGSGAAVGDYQVPIALGTQTGGSIVRPASFNGCYGFKPTWGAISREGLAQWSVTCDTCGFFTRSVDDLQLLGDVFKIKDDVDVPKSPFQVKGAKIGFCKTHNWHKAGPGTEAAMLKAEDILRAAGATIEHIEMPDDFANVLSWHADILVGEGRTSFLGQYTLAKDLLHDDIIGYAKERKGLTRKQQLEAYDNCARLRPVWDDIASKYDAIITPSVVDEAPKGLEQTGDMSFCSTWTILHVPALNVPCMQGEDGFPIGLTMVSPRYTDRNLLHVASTVGPLLEKEGGWVRKNIS